MPQTTGGAHTHPHAHPHTGSAQHNHVTGGGGHTSRRDFLGVLMGGILAGSSLLELAFHRAAWARAAAPRADALFHIQKVTDGIYFARARPQAMINCNAA